MAKKLPAAPFLLWILCGTLIPLLMVFYYGFTDRTGAFTMNNILAIFQPVHLKALGLSLLLSLISTVICMVLAYPLALVLRYSSFGKKGFIIFIFILPMWMNFLLRTMAWQVILERNGIFEIMLRHLHLPMPAIINTPAAIVLGMVYDFLPFMVLPIYNSLMKIDENLIEAAYDLGATKWTVFRFVIVPLTVPGVASGVTMVFVPSLTTFVISNILGGGKIFLIGNIIEQEFTTSANWNLGSGISLVMMLFIVISMTALSRLDRSGEGTYL
ncbi:ABC transporter permease [Eubacterium pyruvativorans]|uniref:ABC transporter permease n=1 Tax=Eubacterium pyruvativorans TaxID=155865 RepID=UPI0008875C33|nr:ABC transporter permease [Eubacterium pyruvativorans]MDO5568483.1 ABC transporter permease [Eubacteriales bacterium]SDE99938.1 spermidine/putrescine transport system permease protein [Eubacterium pyruvativorans]